jgi:hypothetical protein
MADDIAKLKTENEKLKVFLDGEEMRARDWRQLANERSAEITRLRRQNEELREALKPFAEEADIWCPNTHQNDVRPACDVYRSQCANCGDDPEYEQAVFTVGDLRRARALLAPQEATGEARTDEEASGATCGPE